MKIRHGLVLAMAIGFGLTGCASSGGTGSSGGMSSGGSGAGLNPRNTDFTRAAEHALDAAEDAADPNEAQMHYQAALDAADSAMVEDRTNPLAYRLAALASMGVGNYAQADEYFDHAAELRPLYEFDFNEIRERKWIDLYNEATPYVQSGDYETAAKYFEDANAIYDQRPEAMVTLGQIYAQLREHDKAIENLDQAIAFLDSEPFAAVDTATQRSWREAIEPLPLLRAQVLADAGRFEEAVGTYRQLSAANPGDIELKRGLAAILMEMGNEAEASQIYEEMLDMPGLSPGDYFAIGVGFYQSSDYKRAVRAFSAGATASVNDRDALEMWARSLQLDSVYADVPPVAQRWIKLDPNNQNAYIILAQASNQLGDNETTQQALETVDGLQVGMDNLTLRRSSTGGGTVTGSVINKKVDEGTNVTMRFTFYANDGTPLGTVTQQASVGATDMAEVFTVDFDSAEMVGGYSYELTVG